MSDSIHITIQNPDGSQRVLQLSRDRWPLRIGSSKSCHVVLDAPDVSDENALVHRQGIHNYVTALPGAVVKAHGETLDVGSSHRFDDTEITVGDYSITVTF